MLPFDDDLIFTISFALSDSHLSDSFHEICKYVSELEKKVDYYEKITGLRRSDIMSYNDFVKLNFGDKK